MFDFTLLAATGLAIFALPTILFWGLIGIVLLSAILGVANRDDSPLGFIFALFGIYGVLYGYMAWSGTPDLVPDFKTATLHLLNVVSFYLVLGLVYCAIETLLWVTPEKKAFAESTIRIKNTFVASNKDDILDVVKKALTSAEFLMETSKGKYVYPEGIKYDDLVQLATQFPESLIIKLGMIKLRSDMASESLRDRDRRDGILLLTFDTNHRPTADFTGWRLTSKLSNWIFTWPLHILDLIFGRLIKRIVDFVVEHIGGWLRRQGQEVVDSLFGTSKS